MLKRTPQQSRKTLTPMCANPIETVDFINSHIRKNSCEKMTVDISFMNIMDACYVTTLCSTQHYIKYPKGKISWIVSSKEVKEYNKDFDLGNTCYI